MVSLTGKTPQPHRLTLGFVQLKHQSGVGGAFLIQTLQQLLVLQDNLGRLLVLALEFLLEVRMQLASFL